MPEGEFLSPPEVRQIAGVGDLHGQAEALRLLGIPHRIVGRRLLVSRYHVREWLSGKTVTPSTKPKMELVK
jgi:Domain of unknown function (DUF4224)